LKTVLSDPAVVADVKQTLAAHCRKTARPVIITTTTTTITATALELLAGLRIEAREKRLRYEAAH
jgi:hypothetical protein